MRSTPAFCLPHSWFSYAAFLFRIILLTPFLFQPYTTSAQCNAPIAIFPYEEDFEASDGGWVSGGLANDWAWGTPGKPTINTAGSGIRCWITGGLTGSFYSLGQRSFVESPCFDFSLLPHPYIQFKIWWESERQYDGANFQYSLNNGANWINIGASNEPTGCLNEYWYNSSSITNLTNLANPRQGWSGNNKPTMGNCQGGDGSNGWVIAKHCLPDLGGKSNVRFRFTFGTGTTCNDFDGVAFDDINIQNAPPIVANFSNVCTGNNMLAFTDLSTNCPDSWNWNFGDPASGISNGSTSQNPSHTFSSPGLYTVSLQASNSCSGATTISFPIEILGLNTSIVPPSCIGGKDGAATAALQTGAGSPNFEWSTEPPQFGPTATHLSAGTYTVSVSGAGICPLSSTVVISDPDPSQVQPFNTIAATADTTIALGNSVSLSGIIGDPGRVISYQWTPAIYLDCDTCLNTLATPLQTTTYALFALDTNGCVISDALMLRVLLGTVYIPNVFRPLSGDSNSHFTAFAAKDVEKVELLQIYDRWGSLVFENRAFPVAEAAFGWDGTVNGQEAATGVYLYVIKVRFLNGVSEVYKGDVTLLR